jgi:hypothetical protein
MKVLHIVAAFAIACWLSSAGDVLAKGAGGGHGSGGHSSGGHSSGGHSSGGHASGGRSSGGHASGSHAGTTSHGHAGPRGDTSRTASSAPQSTGSTRNAGRAGDRSPSIGTAVPRSTVSARFAPGSLPYLPSRVVWPAYSTVLGFSAFGLASDALWPMYGDGYSRASSVYEYGSAWPYSGYGATSPFDDFGDTGSVRLQVEPKDAQVYVDGYYAGIVDEFDGHFQHLDLSPRPHHVEIRAPGHPPLAFDVVIQPHHKTDYRGTLLRLAP